MHVCLAVICHLHFWQNDRDLLCATVVTLGWNGYQNKSQHRKLTPEKKILPLFLQGFSKNTQKDWTCWLLFFWGKATKKARVAQLFTFSSLKFWLQLQSAEPWKDHIKNKQTNKQTKNSKTIAQLVTFSSLKFCTRTILWLSSRPSMDFRKWGRKWV